MSPSERAKIIDFLYGLQKKSKETPKVREKKIRSIPTKTQKGKKHIAREK